MNNQFKALPFKKKLEHIWEYYHWHMFTALLAALLLLPWFWSMANTRDPLLDIEMINAYGRAPDGEAFQEFLEEAGYEYFDEAVVVSKNIQLNGEDPSANFLSSQLLFATITAAEADLFFWDTDQVMPALQEGILMDLRKVLEPELLEQYQDCLLYSVDPENGEEYPSAIYLDHNPWIEGNMYYVNCSVGVAYSAKDLKLVGSVLRGILE